MSGFELARYTLSVRSPEVVPAEEGSAYKWEMSDQRLLANLPAMMEAVEEDLQTLVPEGYRVEVREFSKPPGPGFKPAGMHWMRDVPLKENPHE